MVWYPRTVSFGVAIMTILGEVLGKRVVSLLELISEAKGDRSFGNVRTLHVTLTYSRDIPGSQHSLDYYLIVNSPMLGLGPWNSFT